jgi:catecholate siderophore receptor
MGSAAAASLCLSSLAHAADAEADSAAEANTIIVTGTVDGYKTLDTTTGTKTNTPIIDVPIEDQAIRSMADLVRLVPGVSSGQGEGHRDQITLRGNNSTADFFVDGLRDDVQYFRSFYNVDRVEVHKGPNAMIFGRGGGGGLVNRVTKGALDTDRIGATVSADNFGAAYAAADSNFAFGGAGLRVNAFYEALNNHRDGFDGDRYAINPVLGANLGETVKLQLGYEYVSDDRVVDRGIPAARAGTLLSPSGPLRDFRDAFFGVRGVNETDFEAHVIRFRGEAGLGNGLTFSAQAQYGDYDKLYRNVFAASPVFAPTSGALTGIPAVTFEAYADPTERQSLIGQTNLEWRGSTGGIDHVLLLGAEYTDQDSYNERINGFFSTANIGTTAARRINIALSQRPIVPVPAFIAGAAGNSNRAVDTRLEQVSAYVQDQISFGDHFDVIAGLRYDRFDLEATNLFTNARFVRVDDLWSPRIGLVAKPSENASVYVSYSRSFLPQSGDQFIALDLTSAALEPEKFDNYEIGAKWDPKPGLSLTVAIYRLDRSNTRAAGPVATTDPATGASDRALADGVRICQHQGPHHRDDKCRPGRPRGRAGAAPPALLMEPLRSDREARCRAGALLSVQPVRDDFQHRPPARPHKDRRGAVLQVQRADRGSAERRESDRQTLFPGRA